MANAGTFPARLRYSIGAVAVIGALFLLPHKCRAQAKTPAQSRDAWAQALEENPALLEEFGNLFNKLQERVHFPPPRGESRLLPLLPVSTIAYAALPNYGEVAQQGLKIFRQELQDSSVLRDWWRSGELATTGPKIEDFVEKFSQLHQYLGEEIVFSGTIPPANASSPNLLIVAEVRKPGLKDFLQQTAAQVADKSKPALRVLDLQDLATAKDSVPPQEFVVLVRPDFVIGASDLATLRSFNDRLNRTARDFAATPFGQRIADEYRGGVTALAGADLHRILSQVPPVMGPDASTFQRTGFADLKYFVWDHKIIAAEPVSQAELSFMAPRHGAASWLAKPRALRSLDFASPQAMLALGLALANPNQIFDDAKELAAGSTANPFAAVTQFEQGLQLSAKNDLLGLLTGELTVELDAMAPPKPAWKVMLGTNDANHLQRTLNTLTAAAHFETDQVEDAGITYHTLRIPSSAAPTEISYALLDGYLVVGATRDLVSEAVHVHRSGGSLAKSKKLLAALPPGHAQDASALLYEDPVALNALRFQQSSPGLSQFFARSSGQAEPGVVWFYGDESAIREASTGQGPGIAAVLIVAAIAIPNLLRSKMAANEAAAVGTVRTVVVAEVTYSATYPDKTYAPNLVMLGPNPRGSTTPSPEYADLLNETLVSDCGADGWCTKSGYRFKVTAICNKKRCDEYVVVATPIDSNKGTRSFCSVSDGVIRSQMGAPLTSPLTGSQCKSWPAIR